MVVFEIYSVYARKKEFLTILELIVAQTLKLSSYNINL